MSAVAAPPVPENRLERFRAARARLDPSGDPADALEQFYIDAPGSVSARLAAELALAPGSSHLLIGGVGSGKTTELLETQRRIAGIPDVKAFYIDVTKRHDIAKMIPAAIVAQVALSLADCAVQLGLGSIPEVQSVRGIAHGTWEQLVPDFYDERDPPMEYVSGILTSPEEVAANVQRVRYPLESLLRAIRTQTKHVVVLLDGLDRIGDLRAFEQVVEHDIKTLSDLGIGVVLVGPLRVQYGLDRVIVERFDSFHYQPWIDVTESADGREFLRSVLARRAGDAFDRRAFEPLLVGSGGVLRDLMALAQSSLVGAYMGGAECAGVNEVADARENFGRKHLQGLRPPELQVLQRVRRNGTFVETSEDDLALLMTRRVLEYRGKNQPRYAVHPTTEDLLRNLAQ